MGACYSVTFKLNVKDEKEIVRALNEKIKNDEENGRAVYGIEKYGNKTDTLDGLMGVILAEHQGGVGIKKGRKYVYYSNSFDASYGWESLIYEWFEEMVPFLEDGSVVNVYPDEGHWKCTVKGGKMIE